MISPVRLSLAEDGKTVVLGGDPAARTILVGEGCELADDRAKELGILDGDGRFHLPGKPPPSASPAPVPTPAAPN